MYQESSANVEQIVKILLRPDFVGAHLPVIFFSLQETRLWDVRICKNSQLHMSVDRFILQHWTLGARQRSGCTC